MVADQKSPESSDVEELLKASSNISNGEEENTDPFITIYADESCKDSAKLRYNPKTLEFDIPDQYGETLLAEVYFNPSDTVEERDLKLQKIDIIMQKKDEIEKKKALIRKWIAIHMSTFWKELYTDEKEICQKFSYYIRVQSAEEHIKMLTFIVEERRKKKCIQYLNEAMSIGCATIFDAYSYFSLKRKNSTSWLPTATDLMAGQEILKCIEYKLKPSDYMEMHIWMMKWIVTGNVKKKSDAHLIMKVLKFTEEQIEWIYDTVMMKIEMRKKNPTGNSPDLLHEVIVKKNEIRERDKYAMWS